MFSLLSVFKSSVHRNREARNMATLQGKTALVPGAPRGMGRATALALANAGPRVLVHYRRAVAEAKAVVVGIRNTGGHADALEADLAAADVPVGLSKQARDIHHGLRNSA